MINLTIEQKKMLLSAVSKGEIDENALRRIYDDNLATLTEEELEKRIIELDRKLDWCDTMKKHGKCPYNRHYTPASLPKLTPSDIVQLMKSQNLTIEDVNNAWIDQQAYEIHAKRNPQIFK